MLDFFPYRFLSLFPHCFLRCHTHGLCVRSRRVYCVADKRESAIWRECGESSRLRLARVMRAALPAGPAHLPGFSRILKVAFSSILGLSLQDIGVRWKMAGFPLKKTHNQVLRRGLMGSWMDSGPPLARSRDDMLAKCSSYFRRLRSLIL